MTPTQDSILTEIEQSFGNIRRLFNDIEQEFNSINDALQRLLSHL